jgi:hypothetical protein
MLVGLSAKSNVILKACIFRAGCFYSIKEQIFVNHKL